MWKPPEVPEGFRMAGERDAGKLGHVASARGGTLESQHSARGFLANISLPVNSEGKG